MNWFHGESSVCVGFCLFHLKKKDFSLTEPLVSERLYFLLVCKVVCVT